MKNFILFVLNIGLMVLTFTSCGSNESEKSAESTENSAQNESEFSEVKIGNQVWMATNLDVTNFKNGDPIRQVTSKNEWKEVAEGHEPAWCYNDFDSKKGNYKLYNWWAVIDERGLAPNGWHVPKGDEFMELIKYLGGVNNLNKWSEDVYTKVGLKLKSSSDWIDKWGQSGAGNNSTGFNALPNHWITMKGEFQEDFNAYLWGSSRSSDGPGADVFVINGRWGPNLSDEVSLGGVNKSSGLAVRCLKN